jgi:hypothetical protein
MSTVWRMRHGRDRGHLPSIGNGLKSSRLPDLPAARSGYRPRPLSRPCDQVCCALPCDSTFTARAGPYANRTARPWAGPVSPAAVAERPRSLIDSATRPHLQSDLPRGQRPGPTRTHSGRVSINAYTTRRKGQHVRVEIDRPSPGQPEPHSANSRHEPAPRDSAQRNPNTTEAGPTTYAPSRAHTPCTTSTIFDRLSLLAPTVRE